MYLPRTGASHDMACNFSVQVFSSGLSNNFPKDGDGITRSLAGRYVFSELGGDASLIIRRSMN